MNDIAEKSEERSNSEPAPIRTARPMIGFLLCVIAELFYFGANFLIRCMTDYQEISPDWTLMIKELVTVSFTFPLILWYVVRKKYYFPGWKIIGCILIAAFVCEFISSRAFFRSYAILGVVLAMPLYVTFQILTSNLFATTLIGEKISRLKILTTLVLIAAVMFLAWSKWHPTTLDVSDSKPVVKSLASASLETGTSSSLLPLNVSGAAEASSNMISKTTLETTLETVSGASLDAEQTDSRQTAGIIGGDVTPRRLAFGLLITLIAGGGSALYMCIMRGVMRTGGDKQVPLTLSMFMITGSGMVIAAICLFCEHGITAFYRVPAQCWLLTLGAGTANLIGFYFRNLGFRYVSASKIVFVSVLQVLLLTLVGISYFGEQSNNWIWYGLALTILGIVMAGFTK